MMGVMDSLFKEIYRGKGVFLFLGFWERRVFECLVMKRKEFELNILFLGLGIEVFVIIYIYFVICLG